MSSCREPRANSDSPKKRPHSGRFTAASAAARTAVGATARPLHGATMAPIDDLSDLSGHRMAAVDSSYVHGACATPLRCDTLGEAFDSSAARFADRDALIMRHQNVRWSYAELR